MLTETPLISRSFAGQWLTRGWKAVLRHQSMLRTVATSFAVFALWAVQGAVLARLLGPTARGEYGAAILYPQLLLFIGLLGAPMTLARRAAAGATPLRPLRNTALRFGLCTGLVSAAVVVVLALGALPADKAHLFPLCMLCALVLPWDQMRLALSAVDHGSGAFSRYNACRLGAAAALPALLFGLWLLDLHSLLTVAVGTVLASLAGFAIQWLACPEATLLGEVEPALAVLAAEGMPYTLGIVVGNLYGRLDALLILWLSDLTTQGHYAAAVPTAGLLLVAPTALELFAFNVGARCGAPPTGRSMLLAAGWLGLFQLGTAAAFALVLAPLVRLVFGEAFRETVPLALCLLPAFALCGCAMPAEGFLRGRRKPHHVTAANLLGAVVLAGGSVLLVGRYQTLGVPMAACLGQLVHLLWLLTAVVWEVRSTARQPALSGGTA